MIELFLFFHIIISTAFLVLFCNTATDIMPNFHKRTWLDKLVFCFIILLAAYTWEIVVPTVLTLNYFTKESI
jgi:hypothetical protein